MIFEGTIAQACAPQRIDHRDLVFLSMKCGRPRVPPSPPGAEHPVFEPKLFATTKGQPVI
jgi:hypothetical protein